MSGIMKEYDFFKDENRQESRTVTRQRKWIRCKEGVEMYSVSRPKLVALATEAGAAYKIDATILIDTEKFENYLESFRIPGRVIK